jgi:hypothetical protein
MNKDQETELKFIAARNKLKLRLEMMAEFVSKSTPESIGKHKYENLREVASLGLLLILENDWQARTIRNLREDLNAEMKNNNVFLQKLLDGNKE